MMVSNFYMIKIYKNQALNHFFRLYIKIVFFCVPDDFYIWQLARHSYKQQEKKQRRPALYDLHGMLLLHLTQSAKQMVVKMARLAKDRSV